MSKNEDEKNIDANNQSNQKSKIENGNLVKLENEDFQLINSTKKKKNNFWKKIKKIVFFVILIFVIIFSFKLVNKLKHKVIEKNLKIYSDKWIVITSINAPSKPVKALLNLPEPWKVVVIGDKKSHDDEWKDYKNSDKLVYLSVEDQLKLNYKTLKFIPYNSYTRKNIGYLYAIEHGAKEIYDTDDDNELINRNYLNYKIKDGDLLSYVNFDGDKMINPYAYFGHSTVWPRGFRLGDIGKDYINNTYNMTYSNNIKTQPLIYQGIANGDPDVDAIFRLTRSNSKHKIIIQFDDLKKPLLYLPGNYIPINSQNTVFNYKVFPALGLPTTTAFRVCDIWRGYIIEKFSWLYNGITLFHIPTVYQDRNVHNYMKDFKDELALYKDLDKLLNVLNADIKDEKLKISDYFIKIIENLVENNILEKNDLLMYTAFISDLKSFNYNFDENFIRNNLINNNLILENKINFNYYIPIQNKILLQNNDNKYKIIMKYNADIFYNDIILMINCNSNNTQIISKYLLEIYKNYFKNIVFITPQSSITEDNFISCPEGNSGAFSYICIRKVYEKYPQMKGYLLIKDNVIFKPWELEKLDFNLAWTRNFFNQKNVICDWFDWENNKNKLNKIFSENPEFDNYINKIMNNNGYFIGKSDIYYIPNKLILKLMEIFDIMYKNEVFFEYAVPTSFILLKEKNYSYIDLPIVEEKNKENIEYVLNNYENYIFYQPVDLANTEQRDEIIKLLSIHGNKFINLSNL